MQSEFFVARPQAVDAIRAVLAVGDVLGPALFVAEIRTVEADGLWMSPQFGQDTVGLHFTWRRDAAAIRRALEALEPALEPFAPRPHWAKVFLAGAAAIAPRYPRHADFAELVARTDPRGAFRNAWLERVLLPATTTTGGG